MLVPYLKALETPIEEELFPKLVKRKAARMIKLDLEDIGVPYKTEDGVADFHALRHTFISGLTGGNIPMADVMALARHSDIKMTMRYSHVSKERKENALAGLEYGPGSVRAVDFSPNASSGVHLEQPAEASKQKNIAVLLGNSDVCPLTGHSDLVEPKGVEPSTSCMPCKRSPS